MQDLNRLQISGPEKSTLIMFAVLVCKELLTNMSYCARHCRNQCKNQLYVLQTENQIQAEEVRNTKINNMIANTGSFYGHIFIHQI